MPAPFSIAVDSSPPASEPLRARKIGAGHDDPSGWNTRDAAQQGNILPWPKDPIRGPSIVNLDTGKATPFTQVKDGVQQIEVGDGSVIIKFGDAAEADMEEGEGEEPKFDDNLAEKLDDAELAHIAADLLDGIQQDEQSRREVLETRVKGIKLLGLKIEEARGDTGTSSAPLEGMSTVRHPLLLEACCAFQAGAKGELLPAEGPCKVRNDSPIGAAPSPPGQPPLGLGEQPLDELAQALETDMNHFLTVTSTEYVPQHDRMLFGVGFSGDGFVKCYHHPLKMRPVAETVDPEDLIVSNMATDIESCGRVTHRIRMRKSVLRRMQIIGAYRDVPLQAEAHPDQPDAVKQQVAEITGATPEPMRPKDVDYTLYETYVELDLDEFAPPQFKGKGVPLPYRVTIEKDTRAILEITRNWKEEDKLCQQRQVFVQYPFIPALGFYSLGFLHLLGNTTLALTALWREMLDAGQFGNFPGFIYSKQVGRQLSNQFRCPPGGGIGIDLPPGAKITDVVTALPYKDVGPALPAFAQHVEQDARQVAMVSNSPVAEGKQDAPVGTTLALLEQSTKTIGAAFKRLHSAQQKEFKLLIDLLREDPEAMWRHNKKPAMQWTKAQFLQAIEKWEIVPVADPNNPTTMHRLAKAAMLKTLQQANPQIYDPIAVDRRILTMAAIDAEGLFQGQHPQGPDPMMMMLQMRVQLEQTKLAIKDKELQLKAAIAAMQQQGKAADRSSKERIEMLKGQIQQEQQQAQYLMDRLKTNHQMIVDLHGIGGEQAKGQQELAMKDRQHKQEMEHGQQQHEQSLEHERQKSQNELHVDAMQKQADMQNQEHMNAMRIQHAEDQHAMDMQKQAQQPAGGKGNGTSAQEGGGGSQP